MFRKLVKYEFKSIGKWYFGLYAVVGMLAIVLGFWIRSIISRASSHVTSSLGDGIEGAFFALTIFAFAFIVFALSISTFLLIANRFLKSVYGRQGYLTLTLPVSSHQLILSKLTAAVIWSIIASFMIIIGLVTVFSISASSPDFPMNDWLDFLHKVVLVRLDLVTIGEILLYVLYYFTETVAGVLLAYFAISLGQLFKDHRVLLAIVFYFGMLFVITMVNSFMSIIHWNSIGAVDSPFSASSTFLSIILSVVYALISYFGTHYIMTKKVNLQ